VAAKVVGPSDFGSDVEVFSGFAFGDHLFGLLHGGDAGFRVADSAFFDAVVLDGFVVGFSFF